MPKLASRLLKVLLELQPKHLERITSANAGSMVELLRLGRGDISDIAILPNGGPLAILSQAGLEFYDLTQQRTIRQVPAIVPGGPSALSPGGERIVLGDGDRLEIWDTARGQRLCEQAVTAYGGVTSLAWSADGRQVAAGLGNGTVWIWDVDGGPLRVAGSPPASGGLHSPFSNLRPPGVAGLSWSPDGLQLASLNYDGTAEVWNTAGQPATQYSFKLLGVDAPTFHVAQTVAWSPDGHRLAAGVSSKGVYVWDAGGGQEPQLLPIDADRLAWSPDGARLAAAAAYSSDSLTVWDGAAARQVGTVTCPEQTGALAWLPQGEGLLAACAGDLFGWHVGDESAEKILADLVQAQYFAWSPDGMQLVSVGNGFIILRDAVSGQVLRTWPEPGGMRLDALSWLGQAPRLIAGVDTGGEGDRAQWIELPRSDAEWDEEGSQRPHLMEGFVGDGSRSYAWSPDGTRLAGTWEGTEPSTGAMRIWDAASGRILQERTDAGFVNVSWSPDGSHLALDGDDGKLHIWAASSLDDLRTIDVFTHTLALAVWSPDSRQLAVASSSDRELPQVWDTATWQMIHGLVGPTSPVDTLSWSPDGTLLAIGGSWDPAVRVWDVERVLPMLELKGHAEGTRRVLWSPDGTRLLTQGNGGPLRIWGVTQGAAASPPQTQLPSVEPPTATADRQTATPTSRPVEPARPITIAANEMQWDTSGGGQVTFSIARNGQDYDVHVTSLQFEKHDERFTITPEAAAVYRAITAVMQDQGSISLHAPDEPPRGSWTTLQFSDGGRVSVFEDAAVFEGDLSTIYEYVITRIEHE